MYRLYKSGTPQIDTKQKTTKTLNKLNTKYRSNNTRGTETYFKIHNNTYKNIVFNTNKWISIHPILNGLSVNTLLSVEEKHNLVQY